MSRAALVLMGLAWISAAVMPHADVELYANYARAALHSPVLHALPKEYPGASIGLFLLPKLLPMPYVIGFSLLAELALVALLLSSDGLTGRPGWNRRVVIYLALGTLAVLVARYDIVPALAALLAVERARSGRWARAWTWAVLGTLFKLFPLLLLPGFLLAERRSTGRWALRRIVATAGIFATTAMAQMLRAPNSLSSPFRYEFHRGFELESLASSLTLLLRPLHTSWIFAYGGFETVGAHHAAIGVFVDLMVLVGLGCVWLLAARGKLTVEATSLAVLTVAVLGDKAFSEQYLIWIIPLWAYWDLRRGWVLAAVLSTVAFPLLYLEAQLLGPSYYLPTAVAGLRNLVLLVTTVCWLSEQLAAGQNTRSTAESVPVLPDERSSAHQVETQVGSRE